MSHSQTVGLFLLATLLFGTAFPAVKTGLSFIPPLLFAASRNYLSALLLLAYVGATKEYWTPRSRQDWLAVLAGGAFMIGGTGFGFVGQQFISSGVAAVIFSFSPVVTGLLAWGLLPAERLSGRDYLAVLVGFVGVAIVVRPDPAHLVDPDVVGKLLVLLGVSVVALGTVLVRRSHSTMPIPALTGWAMLVGGSFHAGFALVTGESMASVDLTPLAVATVVYLGVFAGALGFVSYLTLMGTVGPLKATLVTYLVPLVALGVGWWFLGERIQPVVLVGFAVIVAGFALLESRELIAELGKYRGAFR
ncbi:DMT family transporter [Halobacterium zhouii]|uniref:DMT family transporter n=1 Tax=Halobacterium zhouii TaxID=2902624 RepID=UPI001E48721A|nr:DMT family transporter [Halobacterium zhouii]